MSAVDFSFQIPGLLISVRNVDEARIVDQAGVDILDIKEPRNGALGKADDLEISMIIDAIDTHTVVSGAFGEVEACEAYLRSHSIPARLDFAKCGLAGSEHSGWQDRILAIWSRFRQTCRPVAVAYADHSTAQAPPPEEILELAIAENLQYFLIDTYAKVNTNSLTTLGHSRLMQLINLGHRQGIKTVLAGSISLDDVESARQVGADLIGVRGAVCNVDRTGAIDANKVLQIKRRIEETCLQNR